jgi:hypothetical protein
MCVAIAWGWLTSIAQAADPVTPEQSGQTSPWFTGTLLSSRGSTVDAGHWVIEPYVFFTQFGGLYNNNWRLQSAASSRTIVQQTYLIYGLTDRLDLEVAPQWLGNYAGGESVTGFGDFPISLGFQALRGHVWMPDVRLWVQETFPTGNFEKLPPTSRGLGGTGGGSFATTLGLAFQKPITSSDGRVFRYRFNASYGFYSSVGVEGFNSYGGGIGTHGRVRPGSLTTVTAAGEYTITQRVVLALDVTYQIAQATRFAGDPGLTLSGGPAQVGRGYSEIVTIAPAIEYFFNSQVGVIAGPWMSLRGRNASEFFGLVAALYVYL